MTLLKDLIDIPEHVQRGDFVLKLTEGVDAATRTLHDYVVTPELARCFDQALTIIGSAVRGKASKATYLHGSFGSGKSHFMAVLHLILQGNAEARGIHELASVIRKHNDWLQGRKFLLVPYHMIGARSMESAILGNYVDFMRRRHPEAPIPPVYASSAIVDQAREERRSYGDEPFFRRLNEGSASTGGGWGDLEAAWDADSFDAAADAPPDSEEHLRLVSALLRTVARAHADARTEQSSQFVRFDRGLSILSRHAKDLGYDAMILFLDELILWLATQSADLGFVKSEASKLTNLVESQTADRPIPLISFVARQRDLRELVGDHVPGAEKLSFGDALDYQQGRFETITLEDRNLPAIAEKRVLRVRSSAARQELDASFEQVARMRESVMNILLTQEGDRTMFRQVYPFTPALVQTLIAVSSVLQRERTALKVMMQLLVDQRERLKVGEIIPVGDLFDVVAHGDEAFSADMATHFENAQRLYQQKLLPLIERDNDLRHENLDRLDWDDPRRQKFRADDRLIKTLLLSALVPQVEALRNLNADKLTALNHGSIRTPIPGREPIEVLNRCRRWASQVGEIRVGDESSPTITVQLSGVDTKQILDQVLGIDQTGNRIRLIRQMLFDQLGIDGRDDLMQTITIDWRGTTRHVSVLFRNIRDLPLVSLDNGQDEWRLVIDYPFDDSGFTPRDDIERLQEYLSQRPEGSKTLCWVPSFFSAEAQGELGTLVKLEHLLTGERFGQYVANLSPQDRGSAKAALESQRSVLRHRVRNHLEAAYGLDGAGSTSIDRTHDLEAADHYVSLLPGLTPRVPAVGELRPAMLDLIAQGLAHEFPAAPAFPEVIRTSQLKRVWETVRQATEVADGRVPVDRTLRLQVRQVVEPLQIGEMGIDATHFLLGDHWKQHFNRRVTVSSSPPTVGELRQRIDEPRPMGLPREMQNLLILLYAAQTNRVFYRHGGPDESVSLSTLPDDCELRDVALPKADLWEQAIDRAASIFGITASKLINQTNVARLVQELKRRATGLRESSRSLRDQLRVTMNRLDQKPDETSRYRTSVDAAALVERLSSGDGMALLQVLVEAPISTSGTAIGECLAHGDKLLHDLRQTQLDLLVSLSQIGDHRSGAAEGILNGLREALSADEHVIPLGPALKTALASTTRLLIESAPRSKTPADHPPTSVAPARGSDRAADAPTATAKSARLPSSSSPTGASPPAPSGTADHGALDAAELSQALRRLQTLESHPDAARMRVRVEWWIE